MSIPGEDAGSLLFLLRGKPDESGQPGQDAVEDLHAGKRASRPLWIRISSAEEEFIHACFPGLPGAMALAGAGFSNCHHRTARAVKDHPDYSFDRPCDQGIDRHGK